MFLNLQREIEQIQERKRREAEKEKKKWEGIPPWKALIIKRREEEQMKKEKEERQALRRQQEEQAKWEQLPQWKKDIYQKKGFKPLNPAEVTLPQNTESQVTRGRLLFERFQLSNHNMLPHTNHF